MREGYLNSDRLMAPIVDRLKGLPRVFGIRLDEEAGYEILKEDGPFEIRRYDDLVFAKTSVDADFTKAGEVCFKRLAGYVFGRNHFHENFSKPGTPSTRATEHHVMSMTTPIFQGHDAHGWTMSFVLPKSEKFASAPHPDDGRIYVVPVPTEHWAVLRFSGRMDQKEMRLRVRELAEWICEEKSVRRTNDVRWAQYDSPMTLPFLRRNEVQIRVETLSQYL